MLDYSLSTKRECGHSYDTQGSNHAPLGFFYLVDGCVSIALDITEHIAYYFISLKFVKRGKII